MILLLLTLACDIEAMGKPMKTATRCTSNKSGSTPACWSDEDWEAFCQRARCKADANDCWREFEDCELYDNPTPESK